MPSKAKPITNCPVLSSSHRTTSALKIRRGLPVTRTTANSLSSSKPRRLTKKRSCGLRTRLFRWSIISLIRSVWLSAFFLKAKRPTIESDKQIVSHRKSRPIWRTKIHTSLSSSIFSTSICCRFLYKSMNSRAFLRQSFRKTCRPITTEYTRSS